MHPNRAFRQQSQQTNLDFCRQRCFATLVLNSPDADASPLISHIPFLLNTAGTVAEAHLVRSNPIYHTLQTQASTGTDAALLSLPAALAVSGADAYISPDWYGVADQVPTWNYVAVHLRGRLELLPDAQLADVLARLSAAMEARLLPKPPWHSSKMDPQALEKMYRFIAPIQLRIERVDATWKLSQNKPDNVRENAAAGLQQHLQHSAAASDTQDASAYSHAMPALMRASREL